MKFALFCALALLAGCVSTPTKTSLPNGHEGYAVTCRGGMSTWGDCMEAAAKTCGGKYSILAQDVTGRDGNIRELLFACPN